MTGIRPLRLLTLTALAALAISCGGATNEDGSTTGGTGGSTSPDTGGTTGGAASVGGTVSTGGATSDVNCDNMSTCTHLAHLVPTETYIGSSWEFTFQLSNGNVATYSYTFVDGEYEGYSQNDVAEALYPSSPYFDGQQLVYFHLKDLAFAGELGMTLVLDGVTVVDKTLDNIEFTVAQSCVEKCPAPIDNYF